MAEKSGPEKFAPPDRRPPEKLIDVDQAAANAFEGEIREFVRRDVSVLHRQRSEVDAANDPAAENLNELIRRAAGASLEEIDRVICEVESVRDMLRNEGAREHQSKAPATWRHNWWCWRELVGLKSSAAMTQPSPPVHFGPLWVKSGQTIAGQNPPLSASLIGRLESSTFRLSNTAVLMSLTGSRFSSESALRPFHHGIRGRGGTICYAALPSD